MDPKETTKTQNACPSCPCGGQSCIVTRRSFGDFVHEDYVFKKLGLQVRLNCFQKPTKEQEDAMRKELEGVDSIVF